MSLSGEKWRKCQKGAKNGHLIHTNPHKKMKGPTVNIVRAKLGLGIHRVEVRYICRAIPRDSVSEMTYNGKVFVPADCIPKPGETLEEYEVRLARKMKVPI